jgi:hypothetical protein
MKELGGAAVTESGKRLAKVMNMQTHRPGLIGHRAAYGPPNSRGQMGPDPSGLPLAHGHQGSRIPDLPLALRVLALSSERQYNFIPTEMFSYITLNDDLAQYN